YFLDRLFPCKMNYYRDTKAEGTRMAMKYAENNNINLTVIEPCWVYGEREFTTGFYHYLKSVKNRPPFFIGCRKNNFHVIYANDLARIYYLASRKKLKGIHRIIAGNRQSEKMGKIYSIFCRELGVPKPRNLPRVLVYPIGFILEIIYTVFSAKNPPLLTRGRINMFYDNIQYSTDKAKNMLSFSNNYTLEKGIRNTVKWYKEHNLI
ncbi:MAG: NAD-dependent epimerase/dehydratase family protein, partial [Clostridia bacterium]|nr:NAD-dependent epimerase/dehydratase family protein [Clostridia bacterium]